jgi:amino acid transporter/CheY-like chemotaxis protein
LYRFKRLALGLPLQTSRLVHERLGKVVALAVLASDNISSSAYGTEQVMLPLLVAGAAAPALTFPISVGIAVLLAILILSYRQTITAYPSAGGAYIVTKDNFGLRLAQVAGAALLLDYVLTVAVSVAGGIAAVVTGAPALTPFIVPMSIACIALITWGNLRGVRESGRMFALPTYVYVVALGGVVVLGIFRHVTGHLPPIPPDQTAELPKQTTTIGLLLLMHAYASGCTALTGVEAISNGVPAFRRPEAVNARRTLIAMGTILGVLFLGTSFLAVTTHMLPYPDGNPTLVGQLATYILDAKTSTIGHAAFEFIQGATLLILVLAANTSFADFPRLASFAAGDAFMPRWFTRRGHRLVFSNGILTLAGAATALLVAFKANINSLIPLYAIGVFISFTLSQAGMTRRHLRLREPGWRYGLVVNGLGAVTTFVVLLDVVSTKFTHGAWMVLVALPILVVLLYRTNRAYGGEVAELKVELSESLTPPKPRHEVIVLVEGLEHATLAAVQHARQLQLWAQRAVAVHVAVDQAAARGLEARWTKAGIPLPLEVVQPDSLGLGGAVAHLVADRVGPDTEVTVLLPRRAYAGLLDRVRRGRRTAALLSALGAIPNVHVTVMPRIEPRHQRWWLLRAAVSGDGQAAGIGEETVAVASTALAPPKPRHEVVVLIEGLDRAALRALQYATELRPLSITALHVAVDPDQARRLGALWAKVRIPVVLEVVDCPDRNLLACTERDIHERIRDDTELTVLVPRRRFARRWHQLLLHDRTSTGLLRVLGDLNNVNVTIVPFQVGRGAPHPPAGPTGTNPSAGAGLMGERAAPAEPPARLLLADSDPALRRVLHLALQAHGYRVALADTASSAVEMAGDEHPDLIVLDLSLPGVVDVIRALRQAAAIPILLLTWPTAPDRPARPDVGADDALTKPFGIGQLLDRLQALRAALPPPGHDKE